MGIVSSDGIKTEAGEKTHKARVAAEKKIEQVSEEFAEVQARMNPKYMWAATCTAVKRRPQASAGIGAAVLALGYFLTKRSRKKSARAKAAADEDYELILN